MTKGSKRIWCLAGVCLGLLIGFITTTEAQPRQPDSSQIHHSQKSIAWITSETPHANEFSIWAGYAFDSIQLWGKTPEATLGLFGIRYNRKILNIHRSTLEYSLDVNLYARYTYPEFTYERRKNSITGAGFSPLGLQFNFLNRSRLQPFLKTSGGLMFLTQPFPKLGGRKINFTFGIGGGIEYMLTSYISFSLGYRYFHLSNGETGLVNPGIDSNFFYGGITFF